MEDTPAIVEGEAKEPALEHFTQDLSSALQTGYADAARSAKKPRKDYPFLLYIHKGVELRETFGRDVWKLVLEKAQALILDSTIETGYAPNVDWTGYKNGTAVIATTDEKSRDFVRNVFDHITVEGQSFKAWPKGEKEKKKIVSVKLPASMQKCSTGKAVQAIERANDIPTGGWNIHMVKDLPQSHERLVKLIVDEPTFDRLVAIGGTVKVGLSRLEVMCGGEKLCG